MPFSSSSAVTFLAAASVSAPHSGGSSAMSSSTSQQLVRLLVIGCAGGWACWKPLFRLVKSLAGWCIIVMLEAASWPCCRTAGLRLADQPSPPSQCSSSERDAGRAAASLSRQRP